MEQKAPRRKLKKTNPYGANQYVLDPRQALFFQFYLDPKSDTFSNALQSGIRAGFSVQYSESLMSLMPTWLSEKLGELSMLNKAERNLDKMLDLETREPVMAMFGPIVDPKTKQVITKENANLLRVKADVSKFVAERLNKKKYGANQPQTNIVNVSAVFTDEQYERIAREVIHDGEQSERTSDTVPDSN